MRLEMEAGQRLQICKVQLRTHPGSLNPLVGPNRVFFGLGDVMCQPFVNKQSSVNASGFFAWHFLLLRRERFTDESRRL